METLAGNRHFAVIYVLMIICVGAKVSAKASPLVQAPSGRYLGVNVPGNSAGPYEAFMGIPFAQPPIGNLRFANPVKPPNRNQLHVSRERLECIQKNDFIAGSPVTGSEDCLYLNLYRPLPQKNSSALLPVIVFIHGGAFFSGSPSPSQLGPQLFMNTGQVILMTMAYRLGVFGFLSTGDESSPGNFGLKDQTMALEWLRDNVQSFGGNPANVTIMGVSAGACSVHLHMLSPLSRGLFSGAASLSGNALGPYATPTADPLDLSIRHAALLNIPWQNSTAHLVRRLRTKSANDLLQSVNGLKYWSIDPLTLYRIVVEKPAVGAFLIEDPAVISKNGNYKHVPWVQGSVDQEGAVRAAVILTNETELADLNTRLDELLPFLMELNPTENVSAAQISEEIRRKYLDGKHVIDSSNQQGFIDLYSDRSFLYPLYTSLVDFVRTAPSIEETPVFVYKFSFKGGFSLSRLFTHSDIDFGVVHTDDTLYLFEMSFAPKIVPDSIEANMSQILVQYYVDFAVTGRPTIFGEQSPCTAATFDNADTFCDFQQFSNGPAVHVDNYFDFTMVHFWNELLQR